MTAPSFAFIELRRLTVSDQPPARSDRAHRESNALEADELIGLRLAGRLDRVVRPHQRVAASRKTKMEGQ